MRGAAFILVAAIASTSAVAQTRNSPGSAPTRSGVQDNDTPLNAVREGNQSAPAPRQYDKPFPTGMNWVAISLNGKPLAAARERPSFVLDDQMRARGYSGCNSFSVVAYPLQKQRFMVGPIASTKTACDKAAQAQERAFFVALRTATEWDYESGKLMLKGQGGQLQFERGI